MSGPEPQQAPPTVAGVAGNIARAFYGDAFVDDAAKRQAKVRRRAELRDRAATVQELGIAVGVCVLMVLLAILLSLVIVHVAAAL